MHYYWSTGQGFNNTLNWVNINHKTLKQHFIQVNKTNNEEY